ncbi:MAG: hypothetical protein ACOH2N_06975 [Devosia sp.]
MAARKFSMVSPALWGSKRFATLPTPEAKLLYCYFLTNEHMTSAGAYRIKQGYALADLGWSAGLYDGALNSLIDADLVAYDTEHETVYLKRWFQHNPPMNEKHAQGTRRMILELDSQTMAELAMIDFEEADSRRNPSLEQAPKVSNGLRERLTAGVGRGGF